MASTLEQEVLQAKIDLLEIARENLEENSSRPFGTIREFKLIQIMNAVSGHGLSTELITCSREDFEIKKLLL